VDADRSQLRAACEPGRNVRRRPRLSGAEALSTSPENARDRAEGFLELGRAAEAERELRAAIAARPDDAEAHELLARALLDLGRQDEALDAARTAVALAPDEPHGHTLVALASFAREDFETAEQAASEAIRLAPTWAPYHVVYAQSLLSQDRYEEALEAAATAQKLDPESADAASVLTAAYAFLGRHDLARESAKEALALDPSADHAHATAGFAALARGDSKEAVARFREALRLDPTDDAARAGLVESLKARNPIYGALIRFFLWQGRLPSNVQTAIAFSPLVVTYLVRALGLRDEPVGYGIIGAVVLVLVVMWAAEPLMNLVLLATREGAILLDEDSKRSAYLFLGFLAAAVACVVGAVLGAPGGFFGLAIGYTLFAMGVGSSHHLAGGRRRLVHAAAFALPVCGLVAIALAAVGAEAAANVMAIPVVLLGIASLWFVRFG
jgi:tetratricopeptide (TPR) repeat protein